MSHIFVSHASEDKQTRVKPLVEVLVAESEPVWIDRPGAGLRSFGFDQAYISRNDIDYLGSGHSWSSSLQSALRRSGAVLGCLSKALTRERDVIVGELTVAATMGRLVTCIVDDLELADLPEFSVGLLDMGRIQTLRVRPEALRTAIDVRRNTGCEVSDLPEDLRREWEIVRNLVASVDRVRREPRRMRVRDVERAAPRLGLVPIGPVLKISEVPQELIFAFGDHLNRQERARAALDQANRMILHATEDRELARRMTIREGALPALGATSGDDYWTRVFQLAGLLARRTVAALVMTPVARWAFEQSSSKATAADFLRELCGSSDRETDGIEV